MLDGQSSLYPSCSKMNLVLRICCLKLRKLPHSIDVSNSMLSVWFNNKRIKMNAEVYFKNQKIIDNCVKTKYG